MLGPALGLMRLSTSPERDEARSLAVIAAALDAGVRVFDTAPSYALGEHDLHHNERLLARGLGAAPGVPRAELRIVTKVGLTRHGTEWVPDGRASAIRASAAASAAALGGVPIDVVLLHAIDPRVPLATSVRALAALKDDGVATAVGLSNVNRRALEEALALADISALEVRLGAHDDGALRSGLVAFARERGITVLAHTPLGGPRGAARIDREPALRTLASRHETTPSTLVLAWLWSLDVVPLPGATRVETARLAARANTLRGDLTGAELETIGRAVGAEPRPVPSTTAPLASASTATASPPVTPAHAGPEIVLVMGIQGAGKTTSVASFVKRGHVRLNRDLAGGSLKRLHRTLDERLAAGATTSFVLDNTYPTRAVRAEVLDIARRHGLPVRCVWLETPLAETQVNVVDRMLERHGALLSGAALARAGKSDPGVFLPTTQHRFLRELEPPADDEGFAAIERVPFVRAPIAGHDRAGRVVALDALANPDVRAPVLADAARTPTLVVGWSPPEAPADSGLLSLVENAPVTIALCPHDGGPPTCWCRPPLPGLVVPWLRRERIDPVRTSFLGTSRAHRTLAESLGIAFRPLPGAVAAP